MTLVAVGIARVHFLRAERAKPAIGADASVGCTVLQASAVVVACVTMTLARTALAHASADNAFRLM